MKEPPTDEATTLSLWPVMYSFFTEVYAQQIRPSHVCSISLRFVLVPDTDHRYRSFDSRPASSASRGIQQLPSATRQDRRDHLYHEMLIVPPVRLE